MKFISGIIVFNYVVKSLTSVISLNLENSFSING